MSASEDSTRPISVAELLARNGTIGAPPVSGHRRRRRRNSDSVSVSDLTGEIPVIRDEAPHPEAAAEESVAEDTAAEESVAEETVAEESVVEDTAVEESVVEEIVVEESVVEYVTSEPQSAETVVVYASDVSASAEAVIHEALTPDAIPDDVVAADEISEPEAAVEAPEAVEAVEAVEVAEPVQAVEVRPAPAPPVVAAPPPPRASDPLPRRKAGLQRGYDPRPARRGAGAEQMAPDPVDQSVDLAELVDTNSQDVEQLRSYLTSSGGTLFSGETVADDLARRGETTDADLPIEAAAAEPPARRGAAGVLWHGLIALAQSLLAVVFGAGLFIAFDQLWRWNNIVALLLSVLVILGLVVAVRVVRRTEDIASTLIAVAVGALVTLGPLALLQST